MMKFRVSRRRNPFDNAMVRLMTHVVALGIVIGSIFFALSESSWRPLAFGFVCVSLLEAAWIYFHLRR